MRILLVNDLPLGGGGGVEAQLGLLAEELEAGGHAVGIFAGEVRHRGPARGLDLWDPWARRALASAARRFRPDVVHHHNVVRELSPSVLGVPPAAGCVLSLHDVRLLTGGEGFEPGPAHTPARMAKRMAAFLARGVVRRRVDLVVAHSRAMASLAGSRRLPPVRLVPAFAAPPPASGATTPPQPPSACEDVLVAARLSPEKGVDVLLRAWAEVAPRRPGARLLVAGDGPERGRLEMLAGARPGVRFLGRIPGAEVRRRMAAVRAVVVPSLGFEGGPVVVVEAALAGRPVVVTDAPGAGELVEASGGGLVVAAGDPAALAAALLKVLGDADAADRTGEAGARFARANHTPDHAVDVLRGVYDEALDRRRRAQPLRRRR